ncbi:MAG: hypothetical protein FWG56_12135 [Desulfovibrionaceae bacterium]|nr:hypothetical protein [Desulfovibrionaceae bacterium]
MQLRVNAEGDKLGGFEVDPGLMAFAERMVLSKTARRSWIVLAVAALVCALPLGSSAQVPRRGESPAAMNRWSWATTNQAALRVVALDAKRQQVVVKVDDGDLTILKRGAAIPQLAVCLMAISGSTAVFQPTNAPGREAVERITIALVNGEQVTTVMRLAAPARLVVSGWTVVPVAPPARAAASGWAVAPR